MPFTLTVRDETASGSVYYELPLVFPTETITVRDLIRERVYQEVQDFNRKQASQVFHGLVQPTDTERVLNGHRVEYHMQKHRELDWKIQFEKAIEAFDRNGFFILIDEKQATSLEEKFVIGSKSQISFVRLVPLAGG
jgi:hypothetical protein